MLILARKSNESINIGDDIVITVLAIEGGTVKLGVEAPKEVKLLRGEVYERIMKTNLEASRSDFNLFHNVVPDNLVVTVPEDQLPAVAASGRPVVAVTRKRKKNSGSR